MSYSTQGRRRFDGIRVLLDSAAARVIGAGAFAVGGAALVAALVPGIGVPWVDGDLDYWETQLATIGDDEQLANIDLSQGAPGQLEATTSTTLGELPPAGAATPQPGTWTWTGTAGPLCDGESVLLILTSSGYERAAPLNADAAPDPEPEPFEFTGIPIGEPLQLLLTDPGRIPMTPIPDSASLATGSVVEADLELSPCDSAPPAGQSQSTTTTTSEASSPPAGQAQATTTSTPSSPLTLGDGYYLVPSEILVGTWTMAGTGCGWVKIDGGGAELDKGESDVIVDAGDHTVRLLGGCIWTFAG